MSIHYALLKGKVVGGMRAEVVEEKVNSTQSGERPYRSNHFHILIQADGEIWRCPVNVRSQDGSEVWFKILDAFRDRPILEELPSIDEGLLELTQRRPGRTLDFIREPLFERTSMRHLPKNMAGANNDVQDHLELYVNQAKNDSNAIAYVFGSFWRNQQFPPDKVLNTNQGVHDIHMNQGNDRGHREDDGIYQDGGVIFYYQQTDRYVGIFLAFDSQVWFTDQNGHRLPGYAEGPLAEGNIPPVPSPIPGQPTRGASLIRIIAALPNPQGEDVGKETVTLFNTNTTSMVLDGWKLINRQNQVEELSGIQIETNASVTVRLSGQGIQLSNRGGAIRLLDRNERLVDVVTYTQSQATGGNVIVF